jgi:alpha-tubulin suppressor-like RCC1 family protein
MLGNGSANTSSSPVTVNGILGTATSVSVGSGAHNCIVDGTGAVQCWGSNSYGELGNGSTTSSTTPVTVLGIKSPISLSTGGVHSCAVLSSGPGDGFINGTVRCWGNNVYGQLGNGTSGRNTNSSTPVIVTGVSNAVSVSAGMDHSCAVLQGGSVMCWGASSLSVPGTGTPETVAGISSATSVSVGIAHNCAVLSSGAVQCWGRNNYGQLGNGTTTDSNIPVTVSGINSAISVSAGGSHSCATLVGGTAKCWGANGFGQLGNGTTTNSSSPVTVSGVSTATLISAGQDFTCSLLSGGSVQCWGSDDSGQSGTGRDLVLGFTPGSVVGPNGQGLLNLTGTAPSSLAADADKVFAWAEKTFPDFFSPANGPSQSITGYRYRAYSGGGFLAVNDDSGTAHLYYLGPLSGSTVLDLGLLSAWVTQAGL